MTDRRPPGTPPPLPPMDGGRPRDPRGNSRPEAGQPGGQRMPPGQRPPLDPYAYPPQAQTPYRPPQPQYPGPSRGQGGRRPEPRADDDNRLWKGLALAALGLTVFAGAGVAALMFAVPTDAIRDRIVAEVKSRTGRDLRIAGPTNFTLYPSLGVSMQAVSLSPPPGMSGKPVVTMDKLDVAVRLLPLLQRRVVVERLVLRKPVIELYADAQGRKSWSLASAPLRVRVAQAGAPSVSDAQAEPDPSAAGLQSLGQLHLGDVRLEDGIVRYADAKTGTSEEASQIDVRLGLPDIRQPLTAEGDLVWRNEKLDVNGKLTSVKAILEDRPAKIALSLAGARVAATFDGTLVVRDSYDVEGSLTAKTASVRDLAQWLGVTLPPAKGYGPLEAKGQLHAGEKIVALQSANLVLDGAAVDGQITVERGGERPLVKAALKLSELDLNKYLRNGRGGDGGEGQSADAPAAAPAPPGGKPAAQSIEDLLDADTPASGPRVKGYTQRAGWSEMPLDLTLFGLFDADARMAIGKLIYKDIKVGQTQLSVALKNRVMKTTFEDVQLYGGKGQGFITIDASSGKVASVGANIATDGVDARPFLTDAAGIDRLSGKGRATLAVAGQGANQRQIVETLNGKGDFTFANGAIIGINVGGMVRGLKEGKLTGISGAPSEKTDFSELASTWTISNGIAQNQDLRLVSPLLRVTGAGNVMLPARQVDYMIRPKLVADSAGQGGEQAVAGLEIPVRIHGSWDSLEYTPDLQGVIKDPNKALEAVKEIGKKYKGKSADEIVKDVLGGGLFGKPKP